MGSACRVAPYVSPHSARMADGRFPISERTYPDSRLRRDPSKAGSRGSTPIPPSTPQRRDFAALPVARKRGRMRLHILYFTRRSGESVFPAPFGQRHGVRFTRIVSLLRSGASSGVVASKLLTRRWHTANGVTMRWVGSVMDPRFADRVGWVYDPPFTGSAMKKVGR